MTRLTKRSVEAIKAPEQGAAPTIVWDSELKGFGVLVLPSGTRSYVVQYRNHDGRSRRQTIGRHHTLTADEARFTARELLVSVARGGDPLAEKRARKLAVDVNALLDRYLSDHVDVHNADATRVEVHRLVERHIRPALGRMKVAAVGSSDLVRLHHSLKDTPRSANLVLSIASKAFNLAEIWEYRPKLSNPVRGIARFPENKRKTSLTDAQLGALGAAIREAETDGLPWDVGAEPSKHLPRDRSDWRSRPNETALLVLKLILLTGARLSEILSLRREHVDGAKQTLALPAHKGAPREPHPVGDTAIALAVEQLERGGNSAWVFPRDDDRTRHIAKEIVEKVWRQLRRRARIETIRIHDLRHAFGTFAGQGGNAFLVRDLLRHENLTMTNRYVAANDDPVRAGMAAVEARIMRSLAGVDEGGSHDAK